MKLSLFRYSTSENSTLGLLLIDGVFECYTLEDEFRIEKLAGETRIPQGNYRIKFREVLSEKTKKYRSQHSWFKWHLELQDVPDFKYIYIHKGNRDEDTLGCILVADMANNNRIEEGFIGSSTQAFERLYKKVAAALRGDETVTIEIFDSVC